MELPGDGETTVADIKRVVMAFNEARGWGAYHNPKDLAVSISIESAELLELFQWTDAHGTDRSVHDPDLRGRVADEVADIAIYLVALCQRADIDLSKAVSRKMEKNEKRFPAPAPRP